MNATTRPCPGTARPAIETRPHPGGSAGGTLGRCPSCGRIGHVGSDAVMRRHSTPGRNTAGQDNTLGILWGAK